jgi:ribose transport system substrate-binding protein
MKTITAPARLLFALGTCAMIALALAACGGSGGGGETTATDGASTEDTSGEESTALFPAAAQRNAEREERPTSIGIETPVGVPIPEGKVIDFIQCGVPACARAGDIYEEATALLGWKLNRINAGTAPEEIKAAYQKAIRDEPDGVVGSGYPRTLFDPEVAELKKLGIPVVEAFVQEEPGNGIIGIVGGPVTSEHQGQLMADHILANAEDEELEVGVINVKGFETVTATGEQVEKVIADECPTCETKRLDASVTDIGSDLPQKISSFFTSNPEIEWATVGFSDMVIGLPTALEGAGVEDVKLTTVNINTEIAPYLENGEYLQATVGTSYPEVYWRVIDLFARVFTDQPYEEDLDDSTLPYWTITAETLPSSTETFALVTDYQEQFKQLWGIE